MFKAMLAEFHGEEKCESVWRKGLFFQDKTGEPGTVHDKIPAVFAKCAGIVRTGGLVATMAYVVTESCIKCKYTDCVDVCPVDCFREGPNMLEFDAFQIGKALSVWEAPDILPFGAFVQRLYEGGLYADLSAELPMLLTPAQEEELWKQVVGGSGLLAVEGAAAKCRDAWNLANLWRIRPGAGNQDTEAFARWLTHYKKETENDLDTPRLPDALRRFLPELERPKLVVAYAFDILPPQTKEFLDALGTEIAFCRPDPRSATVSRAVFDSAKHEIEAAARWARARLEAGGKRIGVVVPSLQEDRKEVARVFSRVMRPGGEKAAMPFNISIGIPLERYPVVALALSVLRVSQEEIPFEEASRLVRSPFIGGAETELGARMRLETRLRDQLGASGVLPELIAAARQTPLLRAQLAKGS